MHYRVRVKRKDGLFVVSDTSSGLPCRLCKNICRAVGCAYPVYDGKVFAESHSQVFFGVRDDGDCGCVAQGFVPSVLVFHVQDDFCQRGDSVPYGFDVFVFRIYCDLHCARQRHTLFPKRAPRHQMRLSHRQRFCVEERRHLRLERLFEHFTDSYSMIDYLFCTGVFSLAHLRAYACAYIRGVCPKKLEGEQFLCLK